MEWMSMQRHKFINRIIIGACSGGGGGGGWQYFFTGDSPLIKINFHFVLWLTGIFINLICKNKNHDINLDRVTLCYWLLITFWTACKLEFRVPVVFFNGKEKQNPLDVWLNITLSLSIKEKSLNYLTSKEKSLFLLQDELQIILFKQAHKWPDLVSDFL